MERVRRVFFVIHIVVWTLIFAIYCAAFRNDHYPNWFYLSGLFLTASIAVFYGHFTLLTRYPGRQKIGLYLAGLICILLLGPFLFLWLDAGEIDSWLKFREQYFTTLFSFVIFFVFFSWLLKACENWFTNSIRAEILEKQAVQMELAYLKSQINPHFLFNILNNIHTLVYTNSPSAAGAVMGLSSLMRYMIYESNTSTVPLDKEISYLKDFIDLQQLRFSSDSVVDFQINGKTGGHYVTPLLFIHLLENAYKHSPAKLKTGDIKVLIEIQNDSLKFQVQNPVKKKRASLIEDPGGFGLSNITKRLHLLYHDRYTLEANESGDLFNVLLIVPLHVQTNEG